MNLSKLAEGSFDSESLCVTTPESECDISSVTASFTYSEILSEMIDLDNDLNVTSMSVEIDKEPAPSCTLVPSFDHPQAEPELVINLSNCIDLFANETLEISIASHEMGDEYGIVDLHTAISNYSEEFLATGSHEIRLTIADLQALLGTSVS